MSGVRRLSGVQRKILFHLAMASPLHGFAIASELGLSTATVYPTLHRMEESGLISSTMELGDPASLRRALRRLYQLTDDGSRVAAMLPADTAVASGRRLRWA